VPVNPTKVQRMAESMPEWGQKGGEWNSKWAQTHWIPML